jgi:cytochrome oxidase Cu insertion factor (SCO1/SenC/PrrC family)
MGHPQTARAARAKTAAADVTYECPMHPEVTSKRRGKCPKCGMRLRAKARSSSPAEISDAANAATETPAKIEGPGSGKPRDPDAGGDREREDNTNSGSGSSSSSKYFPNHVLLTQDNKAVRFYDDLLKGRVVLINFIFTTCQGVCTPMTANLARVQSYLAEHMGREVVMISISVDPLTDTPERLKIYADKFKVKPGWYFLTGKKENVDWVLYKLGGYVEDKQTHTSVLIIGNEATGEWMKVHAMSNPTEIAGAVTKLLAPKPDPASP